MEDMVTRGNRLILIPFMLHLLRGEHTKKLHHQRSPSGYPATTASATRGVGERRQVLSGSREDSASVRLIPLSLSLVYIEGRRVYQEGSNLPEYDYGEATLSILVVLYLLLPLTIPVTISLVPDSSPNPIHPAHSDRHRGAPGVTV